MAIFKFFLGAFLTVCFFSLSETRQGLGVHFYGPTGFESPSELNFWLGYILFLTPGVYLILTPISGILAGVSTRIKNQISSMSKKESVISLAFFVILAFVVASVGHDLILLGFPVTDDEIGAKFGGQVLASGRLMASIREPLSSFMHPFMYISGSRYTSFEMPGVGLVWALGLLVGRESLFWSILAALPVLPIMLIIKKYFSQVWAFLAGIIYLFSAQAATLSISTHSHILTRFLVAFALLASFGLKLRVVKKISFGLVF